MDYHPQTFSSWQYSISQRTASQPGLPTARLSLLCVYTSMVSCHQNSEEWILRLYVYVDDNTIEEAGSLKLRTQGRQFVSPISFLTCFFYFLPRWAIWPHASERRSCEKDLIFKARRHFYIVKLAKNQQSIALSHAAKSGPPWSRKFWSNAMRRV